MEPKYRETIDRLQPYLSDGGEVDFSVTVDAEDFAAFSAKSPFLDRPDLDEGPYLYTKICRRILSEYDDRSRITRLCYNNGRMKVLSKSDLEIYASYLSKNLEGRHLSSPVLYTEKAIFFRR